jgi:hypothetical protein
MPKIELNRLVESFAHSFGRITEIGNSYFVVTYSYCRNLEITYNTTDFQKGLYKGVVLHE